MNDSGVFASLYPVGAFPFPLPKMGSLTVEEAEYMADRVRSVDLKRLESIEEFAKAISEKENISIENALDFITKLLDGGGSGKEEENLKLMSFSIQYRKQIAEMRQQNDPNKIIAFQTKQIALMILVSRLDSQWFIENLSRINKTFRVSIEPKEASELLTIPEEQWLSSPKRTEIFERLVKHLPIKEIRELSGFVLAEEREWESIDDTVPPEKKRYSSGYEIIETPLTSNENSTEMPIIDSPVEASPIPSSTESVTTDVQPIPLEKRSKKSVS